MSGRKPSADTEQHLYRLIARAEARLDFAIWRQAYRRLGWSAHLAAFTEFMPPTSWAEAAQRWEGYLHAFENMQAAADAYVEHLRAQYGIAKRAAHGSTNAACSAAAHHQLVGVAASLFQRAPFALILSSALRARPSKDERGHTHARGPPPPSRESAKPHPARHARGIAAVCA